MSGVTSRLDATSGRALLDIAISEIRRALETGDRRVDSSIVEGDELPEELVEQGAAFVSLHQESRLIGCIGSIESRRPLALDVADNALGAAFRDPRLPPLDPADFASMEVEVSVLAPLQRLNVGSYDELQATVREGVDGLLVKAGRGRATLLPSVWEQSPSVAWFLDVLWRKAGFTRGSWPRGIEVFCYTTESFIDSGPRQGLDQP
ncbi:MAG: AmmeMemoRadiSam system protein A [Actinomycetia bacterium]|nr:AmmeMemoRadiSam system protein A [Actinomycetes bacterium]MCP4958097.1 AmmeMemoRadiSam system protein A [Actinomycetes bacterium]